MAKTKSETVKAEMSFVQITILQFGVFASAVFAFLLSMAWNNVVQAYAISDDKENKELTLVIYAVSITVVALIVMTLIAYVTARYTNMPVSKLIK